MGLLNSTWSSIINENNLNLPVETSEKYLSILASIYYLGGLLGNIVGSRFNKMNLAKV